jgi:hypothetical protein
MAKYSYHRLDGNDESIRTALEAVGASVDRRSPGDWLVGFRGVNYILEVKTANGKQNPSQQAFQGQWKGQYDVVRDVDTALRVIGALERQTFQPGSKPWEKE